MNALDNMRGGTLRILKVNAPAPGVQRAFLTSEAVMVTLKGTSPLVLPDAIDADIPSLIAFGGTEQRNIPQPYTQVNYVTNTAQTAVNTGIMIDFAKNYEFEVECRAVGSSWYILQSRASSTGNITGIHGATSGSTITLVVGNVTVCTSAITRTVGNKLYVKATLNAGTATLYVKDETANTEDTQTGSYGTSQPNPTAAVYLLGNAGGQYADINSDIYMARIKENDTVVMDYVPARQVATAGFYDKASGTFKTAETPANLSADGNTVPTPDAPMDIVSNNGVIKFGALGKNLLDPSFMDNTTYETVVVNGATTDRAKILPTENGKTYTLSARLSSTAAYYYYLKKTLPDGTFQQITMWYSSSNSPSVSDKKYSFTASDNAVYVVYFANTPSVNALILENYQLELGSTATEYEPYRAGIYTDGTVETIAIKNNIFTLVGATYDETIGVTGNPSSSPSNGYSDYLAVTSGDVYNFSNRGLSGVALYDQDKVFISRPSVNSGDYTIPNNVAYIRVNFRQANMNNITITYTKSAAICEDLLSIGNYTDEQEIIDGTVTRKVGVLVLDGTEAWSTTSGTFTLKSNDLFQTATFPCLCTHYKGATPQETAASQANKTMKAGYRANPDNDRKFYLKDQSFANTDELKTFLANQYAAGTPVIVVYPLKDTTTETVTPQPMQTGQGDNTAEITQASLDGLELQVTYMAGVQLTVEEVEDEQLSPNVEVTIQ